MYSMKFHVITLFPEIIEAYAHTSILGRAVEEGVLNVQAYQMRDTVENKWGKVDERPYGGGPGMVITPEPVIRAAERIRAKHPKAKIIITAAGGVELTNAYAKKLTKQDNVIIICGRYEGIDARVKKILRAEEVSVGPYILTGGEIPALAIIDATARQIPGVLGKFESLEESRVASHEIYTRPPVLEHEGKKYRVPTVLLSGDHAKIDAWKEEKRSNPNSKK